MFKKSSRIGECGVRPNFFRLKAQLLLAPILAIAAPAIAQAQLVSQIQSLSNACGGFYQGNDYGSCSAGEISISQVATLNFEGDPVSCVLGEQLTIATAIVEYEIRTTTRYDLVLWIGNEQGTDPRLDYDGGPESCSAFSVPGPFTTPPTAATPFGDVDGDQCGDVGGSPTGTFTRTFTNVPVTCQDNDNDGFADLQVLLTWSQNAGQECGTRAGETFPTVGAVSKCDYNLNGSLLPVVEPPVLTLVKQVTNNSGGTAVASAWTLTATAGLNVITGATGSAAVTNQTVAEGTYTLSEAGPAGYTGTWNCTGGGTFTPPNQITLANATPGQDVTCTVTNNDNPGTLTLVKDITNNNGGASTVADWTLTATGASATVTGLANSDAVVSQSVPAGNYTLTESGPAGYSASAWSCPGGTLNGNVLSLALGQNITCTITNDDQAANLTLTKIVVNDNGGTAVPGDWTLLADALGFTSGVQQPVDAGTLTLSETNGPAGYTAGSWQCTGGSFTPPDQLTLALGQTASCSITNDDQAPGLTLLKDVTNDNGGNDTADSFDLNLAGGTFGAGQNFVSGATPTVVAGVVYTLSETPNTGYSLVNIVCVDNSNQSTISQGLSPTLNLGNGQTATCTYFNDDNAPRLTLVKDVTNDHGGEAVPGDFTLTLQGIDGVHNSPQNYTTGAVPTVLSNVSYTMGEITLPLYTNEGVTCEDDDSGASVAHPVSLAEGQRVTCTITNNDQERGSFTIVKDVSNDDGGEAVAGDFTLRVTGTPDGMQNCGQDGTVEYSSGDSISPAPVDGCTYTVSEDALDGYTQTGISCLSDNSPVVHPVAFSAGDVVVCTISNTDDGAMLALTKIVTNDNGGTALITDWNLAANGPTTQQGNGGFASIKVSAGVYTLSESAGPAGYLAGTWNCGDAASQLDGNQLSLANGDDVTCTITNNDVSPQLTLTKVVVNNNGGAAVAADWTLSANAINFTSGQTQGVNATTYTLSESGPSGYSQSGPWQCSGGSFTPPNQLALVPGDIASCSVTNDDVAPSLTLVKAVINDDGALGVPSSFTLTLTGTDGVHNTAQPYSSGSSPVVVANVSYTVDEQGLDGYVNEGVVCVDTGNGNAVVPHPVTLGVGQAVTCTLTNNDVAPTLNLTKIVINDGSGEAVAADFTLVLTGADGTHDSGVNYSDGDSPTINSNVLYTLSEQPIEGYELLSIECVDSDTQGSISNPFTPARGQNIACTVTNDDKLSDISYFRVTKDFTDDNPGEVDVFIDCTTGFILDQTKTITEEDGVIFVVTSFDAGELNCSIFENPIPAGYSNEYAVGLDNSNGNPGVGMYFENADGCHFEEVEGGDFYCTIINEVEPTEVVVNKVWYGEFEANGLSRFARADYSCFNVRTSPAGNPTSVSGELFFEGDSSDEIAGIFPHWDGESYCTVDETYVDNAVEQDDSDCSRVSVALETGGSCTIYNTLFLEGIPTLNPKALVLLAMLMLGVGLVGFRRFS